MSHKLITGTFILVPRSGTGHYQPDGDTIRFQADQPDLIETLERRGDDPKSPASIRFEAIDALEKDQEKTWAKASRDRMFQLLGLAQTSLSLGSDEWSVHSANLAEARGYIIAANALDKYGRVIAFVYSGIPNPVHSDGDVITPTENDIQSSVNRTLILEGLVYPTFYSGLDELLRGSLANDAKTARDGLTGLWPHAVGMPGNPARITNKGDLTSLVLFPTLHRRLVKYLRDNSGFDGFAAWVRNPVRSSAENKEVRILVDGTKTDLPDILIMSGSNIGLRYQPEDFIFMEAGTSTGPETVAAGDLVIVGVLANAVGPERGGEVVTLLNTTGVPINLTGWYLRDNAGRENLDGNVISAGETLRIVPQVLQLGNRMDKVELHAPNDDMIDKVAWTEKAPEGRTLIFPWPRT